MAINNFLPFCPTDTGTNLLSNSEYSAASDRTNGNQPGTASSKLANRALRQSAFISSSFAQLISNMTQTDMIDSGNSTTQLIAQMTAALSPLSPAFTKYTSGSGTHNLSYVFFIASGSATVGATYTNNAVTFTVKATVASATQVIMTASGAPAVSGTLTKASGTGDATLTFYAARAPISLRARIVGGGGGSSGTSTAAASNGGAGGAGGNTTFGSSLLTANGGAGGVQGGAAAAGGTASLGSATGLAITGGCGNGSSNASTTSTSAGGAGGASALGGAGGGGSSTGTVQVGTVGAANTGGGGGATSAGPTGASGAGGAAGGYVDAVISSPTGSYAYAVGAAGTAGAAGTSGSVGLIGGSGVIFIEERYQ